jgi:formamidopyrimidine-DNA glycosylase
MPELPEVETVANGVHDRVHGRRILSVWTSGKPQTFKSPESEIAETLTGARIASVRRVGKTIVMTVVMPTDRKSGAPSFPAPSQRMAYRAQARPKAPRSDPAAAPAAEFLIHLGMTGRLLVSQPEVPIPPHTHAILSLDDRREVRFVDPRRFGRLSIHHPKMGTPEPALSRSKVFDPKTSESAPQQTAATNYTGPGREPLTVPLEDFIALFRKRKTPIKAALLNQSLLHGVGNIYADEALFRAAIRPRRQAARVTRAELARLRTALIEVLTHAIALGGSSVSDYVDADGVRGFFQLQHKVYRRTGQPCLVCKTPIQKITVAGRSTHFCPKCQK